MINAQTQFLAEAEETNKQLCKRITDLEQEKERFKQDYESVKQEAEEKKNELMLYKQQVRLKLYFCNEYMVFIVI